MKKRTGRSTYTQAFYDEVFTWKWTEEEQRATDNARALQLVRRPAEPRLPRLAVGRRRATA